ARAGRTPRLPPHRTRCPSPPRRRRGRSCAGCGPRPRLRRAIGRRRHEFVSWQLGRGSASGCDASHRYPRCHIRAPRFVLFDTRTRPELRFMDESADGTPIAELWEDHRRYLRDLAFRMLGNIADAEDMVQEAFVRLMRADVDAIDDVRGWLVVVVSRLCLDHLRSARVRREQMPGADI